MPGPLRSCLSTTSAHIRRTKANAKEGGDKGKGKDKEKGKEKVDSKGKNKGKGNDPEKSKDKHKKRNPKVSNVPIDFNALKRIWVHRSRP